MLRVPVLAGLRTNRDSERGRKMCTSTAFTNKRKRNWGEKNKMYRREIEERFMWLFNKQDREANKDEEEMATQSEEQGDTNSNQRVRKQEYQ